MLCVSNTLCLKHKVAVKGGAEQEEEEDGEEGGKEEKEVMAQRAEPPDAGRLGGWRPSLRHERGGRW